jgi:hypothetical protein
VYFGVYLNYRFNGHLTYKRPLTNSSFDHPDCRAQRHYNHPHEDRCFNPLEGPVPIRGLTLYLILHGVPCAAVLHNMLQIGSGIETLWDKSLDIL